MILSGEVTRPVTVRGLRVTKGCLLYTSRLTARQIEAARRAMTRAVKRQGKIWIRVFPDRCV